MLILFAFEFFVEIFVQVFHFLHYLDSVKGHVYIDYEEWYRPDTCSPSETIKLRLECTESFFNCDNCLHSVSEDLKLIRNTDFLHVHLHHMLRDELVVCVDNCTRHIEP